MAGKPNDDTIAVEVDDTDTILVEVDGEETQTPQEAAPVPKKEPRTRKRVSPDPVVEDPNAHATAIEEAQAYAKQQEDGRKAAEATAAAERARAEQAERDRQRAVKDSETYHQQATASQMTLIDSNIAAAERDLAAQQEAYVRAAEAGEFVKLGEIQVKIAKAAAALDRLGDAKVALENQPVREEPTYTPPPVNNRTEQFMSQFAPEAQTWLRQHMDCLPPEHGGSMAKNAAMMQGHYAAVAKGIPMNSPEYFRTLDEALSPPASPKVQEAPAAASTPKAAPPPSYAAPPTREAPNASERPRNVREVRLTKEQQEMAKVSFPHLPEQQAYGMYARNLIELEAEGKMGRTTH